MLRVQVPGRFGREEVKDELHSRTGLLRHSAQGLSDRLHGNWTLAKSGESNIVCSVKSE